MALIKCPECEREISEKAYWCVHCGYPIRGDFFQTATAPAPAQTVATEEQDNTAPTNFVIKVTKYKSGRDGDNAEGRWPMSFPNIETVCPDGKWQSVRYIWENNGKSELFSTITVFNSRKEKLCVCGVSNIICVPGMEEIYITLTGFKDGAYPSYIVLGDVDALPEDRACYTGKQASDVLRCPKCGSTSISTGSRGVNWTFGMIGASNTVNRCAACGHTWQPRG